MNAEALTNRLATAHTLLQDIARDLVNDHGKTRPATQKLAEAVELVRVVRSLLGDKRYLETCPDTYTTYLASMG